MRLACERVDVQGRAQVRVRKGALSPPLPPSPPPSPPSPPPEPVVDRINRRFREGRASNDLAAAGVLVHQFDGQEDPSRPWLPCTSDWCLEFADRFASSIISKRAPHLFNGGAGGLIFTPALAHIFCSYPADGGTMSLTCPRPDANPWRVPCLPGCWVRTPNWCSATMTWECSFPPDLLWAMLRTQEAGASKRKPSNRYNEVMVDTKAYVDRLPRSLEAIVASSRADGAARAAHARILREHGLSAAELPLLLLQLSNRTAPFTDISGA